MNKTITLTLDDEQLEALKSGSITITIEPPKPVITKWEPKGGNYLIQHDFTVIQSIENGFTYKNAGMKYQTKSQAEQAAKALRSYARQLAWLAENDDGWVADWEDYLQNKYFVYFHNGTNQYCIEHCYRWCALGTVYMSEANAEKLSNLLNDGIVEF